MRYRRYQTPLFGTNFKMHQTPAESHQFVLDLRRLAGPDPGAQLFVIPPFTSLTAAAGAAAGSGVWVGAQNMHWEAAGAFTGEISPSMLRAAGADLVMLGHAERRQQFGETDWDLYRKVQAADRLGFRILLCAGDTAEERHFEVAREVVARQLKIALRGLEPAGLERLIIAYEPVWSIGEGGQAAPAGDVAVMLRHIRTTLTEMFADRADLVPILYGGSIDQSNCGQYAELPEVDGLFVGRAAWQVAGFMEVLRSYIHHRKSALKGS